MEALIGTIVMIVVFVSLLWLVVTMLLVPEFNTPHRQTCLPDDMPESFPLPPGVTEEDLVGMRKAIKNAIGQDVSFLYIRNGSWTARTAWGDFPVPYLLKQVNKSGEVFRG